MSSIRADFLNLLTSVGHRVDVLNLSFAPLSSDMYKSRFSECTVHGVDVSVTELRAHLSEWLDRARAGGEVVITDRGIPVARLAALDSAGTLERLTAEGVIGKATAQRPVAAGRSGPRPRRPVSDRVSDQRR
jgi:prevent-host-death family protein